MAHNVLVIDDDPAIRDSLRLLLRDLACQVETEADGPRGLSLALEKQFDIVVVDVNLPGMNGLDICRKLRAAKPLLPILMLTSRSSEMDVLMGLEQGADDYLTKPFRMTELLARIRGMLRRQDAHRDAKGTILETIEDMSFDNLSISAERREVSIDGALVELTVLEFDILFYLAQHCGRLVSREQLITDIWGNVAADVDGSLNTAMSRLRKKLEATGRECITTIRGVGFRFEK